jgi:hypothetical protein
LDFLDVILGIMGDLLHILWRLKVYVVAMVYLGSEHFCVSCADFEEFEEIIENMHSYFCDWSLDD